MRKEVAFLGVGRVVRGGEMSLAKLSSRPPLPPVGAHGSFEDANRNHDSWKQVNWCR